MIQAIEVQVTDQLRKDRAEGLKSLGPQLTTKPGELQFDTDTLTFPDSGETFADLNGQWMDGFRLNITRYERLARSVFSFGPSKRLSVYLIDELAHRTEERRQHSPL